MAPKTSKQPDMPGLADSEQGYELSSAELDEVNRRQRENKDPGFGVRSEEVIDWIDSWGTKTPLPIPKPRKII
jgi:predicted transcriptional regulator